MDARPRRQKLFANAPAQHLPPVEHYLVATRVSEGFLWNEAVLASTDPSIQFTYFGLAFLGRKHVSVCDAMLSSPLTENWRRITSVVRPSCRQSSPCPLPRKLATIRCGRCRARQ